MLRKLLSVALVVPTVAVMAVQGSASAAVHRTCHGHAATIVGTAGNDRLVGTHGADVVLGLAGNDVVVGLGGDDVICGGAGADDLDGGQGDDRLFGGDDEVRAHGRRTSVTGDLLEGGPGDDLLSPGFDEPRGRVAVTRGNIVSYRHSARAVTVDLRGRAADGEGTDTIVRGPRLEIDGSAYDDVLLGSRLTETLDGGRGDDRLSGRGGRDVVLDYHGDDRLDGGRGGDLLISTKGSDLVSGEAGADVLISGGAGTTTLLGGGGFDYLSRQIKPGPTGVIDGGAGEDVLELDPQLWFGSELSATLDATAGTVEVTDGRRTHGAEFTGIGNFILWSADWTFLGTDGDDSVQVLDGRLDAQTFAGDDFMIGGERPDRLDGGDGSDTAWGGGGRNTCLDVESGDCGAYPWGSGGIRPSAISERLGRAALSPWGRWGVTRGVEARH